MPAAVSETNAPQWSSTLVVWAGLPSLS
jgi:hypothetical protein